MARYGRRYGYRRSAGSGFGGVGVLAAGLILFVFYAVVVGIETTANVFDVLLDGGGIYDEEIIREYADEQYAIEFAGESYEDNVLIVILVEPDCEEYHYYVRVGSHIAPEIAELYANQGSTFSSAIDDSVERGSYEDTLSNDLTSLLSRMERAVFYANNGGRFTCQEAHVWHTHLTNHSDLVLNEKVVNRQLERSSLPTVIVMEDMRDVYGYHIPWHALVIAAVTLLATAGVVVLIVYLIRKPPTRKARRSDDRRPKEGTDYAERLDDEYWENRY